MSDVRAVGAEVWQDSTVGVEEEAAGMRECGCRDAVKQCEHYDGRVLQFAVYPQSIVVRLEEEYGLHHTQLSVCHSVLTAHREYQRYRSKLLQGEEEE